MSPPGVVVSLIDWASIVGHLSADAIAVTIWLASTTVIKCIGFFADTVFGKPSIDSMWSKLNRPQRFQIEGGPVYTSAELFNKRKGEIDVEKTLAKSNFSIKPDDLVILAKQTLASNLGVEDSSVLADDFLFCPPVVAPLGKDEFIRIFGSFKLPDAMSDIRENAWAFHVDPLESNRVWWLSRASGTHDGPLGSSPGIAATNKRVEWPVQANSMLFNEQRQCYQLTVGIAATNKRVEWPVQANSMLFNEQRQCYQLTVGYSCDKQIGNTGGLGAVFGLLQAVGKPLPFPEARPWKPSPIYRFFMRIGKVAERFGVGPGLGGKGKAK
eukprot:CAMPEP_0173415088 /NCGR_PEP_ID=MMETSP1356-20130122/84674_1 /TAXON_ID=77927 ORGANISM="Hemiselmis virescens, Strain PCC157" /NCGR_SAMPLE_ID=MMETSP1356 /ASSEMBLY_ACC=CAM_ASM_000847 /LENGTH=325 /DNA_ID=CAMNT_0014377313 /DNA_START=27 /DNA_END=1004 /DNA_ORIENTATION=+